MRINHLPTIVHVTLTATASGHYVTPSEFSRFVHTGINGSRLNDREEEIFAKVGHTFEPGTYCLTKQCGCRASFSLHDAYFHSCVPKSGRNLLEEYAYWQTLGAGVAACNFAIAGPPAGEQHAAFYFAGLPHDQGVIREYLAANARADGEYFSDRNCDRFRGRNAVVAYALLHCWENRFVSYRTLSYPEFANVLPFLAVGRTHCEDHAAVIADYKVYMEYRGT